MITERLKPIEEIPYGKKLKYKELCNIFNVEYKRGGYVTRNIERILNEYEMDTSEKMYYIILNRLEEPKFKIIDNRFCINYFDRDKGGIYIIQKDNTVYIGQTKNFYSRFTRHRGGYNINDKKTKELLDLGAIFKVLELEDDLKTRLTKETYYVNKYITDGYNVLNTEKVLYKGENSCMRLNKLNSLKKSKEPKQIKNKNEKKVKQKKLKTKEQNEARFGITFNKSDLDKITKLLSDNNIDFKQHKFRDKKTKESTNVQ